MNIDVCSSYFFNSPKSPLFIAKHSLLAWLDEQNTLHPQTVLFLLNINTNRVRTLFLPSSTGVGKSSILLFSDDRVLLLIKNLLFLVNLVNEEVFALDYKVITKNKDTEISQISLSNMCLSDSNVFLTGSYRKKDVFFHSLFSLILINNNITLLEFYNNNFPISNLCGAKHCLFATDKNHIYIWEISDKLTLSEKKLFLSFSECIITSIESVLNTLLVCFATDNNNAVLKQYDIHNSTEITTNELPVDIITGLTSFPKKTESSSLNLFLTTTNNNSKNSHLSASLFIIRDYFLDKNKNFTNNTFTLSINEESYLSQSCLPSSLSKSTHFYFSNIDIDIPDYLLFLSIDQATNDRTSKSDFHSPAIRPYLKYFKMLNLGISFSVVLFQMEIDGFTQEGISWFESFAPIIISNNNTYNFESKLLVQQRLIARQKQIETERAGSSFKDVYASLFTTNNHNIINEQVAIPYIIARTKWLDETLVKEVSSEDSFFKQVVSLGGGLETRFLRLAFPSSVTFFEIDTKEVFKVKHDSLTEDILIAHPPVSKAKIIQVAIDDLFSSPSNWSESLLKAGFKPNLPSLWIIENLFYFLPEEQVHSILAEIERFSAAGSLVLGDLINTKYLEIVQTIDPLPSWKFGIDDPGSQLFQKYNFLVQIAEPSVSKSIPMSTKKIRNTIKPFYFIAVVNK